MSACGVGAIADLDGRASHDLVATALRGLGAYTRLGKDAGILRWETMVNVRTPGFETNDYAFQTTADYLFVNGNVGLSYVKPTRWYQNVFLVAGTQRCRNVDGDLTDHQVHVEMFGTTRQFWGVNLCAIRKPGLADERRLEGRTSRSARTSAPRRACSPRSRPHGATRARSCST